MKPRDREIIWVIGRKGNEGKTWFQKFQDKKTICKFVTCFTSYSNSRNTGKFRLFF